MIFPITENRDQRDGFMNETNSFDDYLMEDCFGFTDDSPADESDDIERVWQIVRIEEFRTDYSLSTQQVYLQKEKFISPLVAGLSSKVADIILPPPQPQAA